MCIMEGDVCYFSNYWTSSKPAVVAELKYNKIVQAVIQQIKDRKYTQVFENYSGKSCLSG